MKRLTLLTGAIAAVALALSLSANEPVKPAKQDGTYASMAPLKDAAGLTWYPYPEALKLGKKEGKHIMVHFTATWCGWCRKMEKETYTDTSIIGTLTKDFVLTKVWGDQDSLFDIDGYKISERDLGQSEYAIRSYPTLAFRSPEGKNLGTLPGYRQAPELKRILEFVRDRKYDTTGQDTLPVSPGDFTKNSEAAKIMASKCKTLVENSDLQALMKAAKQNLDAATQNCLRLMEFAARGWDKDNQAFLDKLKNSGLGLVYDTQHDCILNMMQKIREQGGEKSTGFQDLLNYYAAFEQTFKSATSPSGTLQTYKESLADLRSQTTQASAKLDVLLQ